MLKTENQIGGTGEKVEVVADVKNAVAARREKLFRSGWKNRQKRMPLISREEDNAFRLLVEWCEEFDTVLSKHRERLSDPTPRMKS